MDILKCLRGDGVFLLFGKRDILSSGERDTLLSRKWKILSSGNEFSIWISDHFYCGIRTTLSSGILDILWDTGHGKRTTLSSGIRALYPLRKCYLGKGFNPSDQYPKESCSRNKKRRSVLQFPRNGTILPGR